MFSNVCIMVYHLSLILSSFNVGAVEWNATILAPGDLEGGLGGCQWGRQELSAGPNVPVRLSLLVLSDGFRMIYLPNEGKH